MPTLEEQVRQAFSEYVEAAPDRVALEVTIRLGAKRRRRRAAAIVTPLVAVAALGGTLLGSSRGRAQPVTLGASPGESSPAAPTDEPSSPWVRVNVPRQPAVETVDNGFERFDVPPADQQPSAAAIAAAEQRTAQGEAAFAAGKSAPPQRPVFAIFSNNPAHPGSAQFTNRLVILVETDGVEGSGSLAPPNAHIDDFDLVDAETGAPVLEFTGSPDATPVILAPQTASPETLGYQQLTGAFTLNAGVDRFDVPDAAQRPKATAAQVFAEASARPGFYGDPTPATLPTFALLTEQNRFDRRPVLFYYDSVSTYGVFDAETGKPIEAITGERDDGLVTPTPTPSLAQSSYTPLAARKDLGGGNILEPPVGQPGVSGRDAYQNVLSAEAAPSDGTLLSQTPLFALYSDGLDYVKKPVFVFEYDEATQTDYVIVDASDGTVLRSLA